MTLTLFISRLGLGLALTALVLAMSAHHRVGGPRRRRDQAVTALARLALGLAVIALLFSLAPTCARP